MHTSTVTSRRSFTTLALVLLGHVGVLAGLVGLQSAPVPVQPPVIQVSVVESPVIAPATPQPPAPQPPSNERTKPRAKPVQQAALLHTPNTATVLQTEATATPANAPTATPPTPAAVTTATPTVTATTSAKPSTAPTASYTPARFDAAYLDNPAPRYPALSRKTGESGKVVLKVHVSAAGLPERIEMHSSSGFERLDNAATTAVQRWKFVPAQQNGEAVAAWVLVPLAFNLKE